MKKDLEKIGLSSEKTFDHSIDVYFISNPDGSPRWIWNAKNKHADFLRFYNISSLKSKAFSSLIKLIFFLRMQHLIFGKNSLKVYRNKEHELANFTKGNFALFTGTTGPNRKLVLFSENQFIKIGLSTNSIQSLENELDNIQGFQSNTGFEIPKARKIANGIISFSDIGRNGKRVNTFTKEHANALKELTAQRPSIYQTFNHSDLYQQFKNQLNNSNVQSNSKITKNIKDKLELMADLLANKQLRFNWSHRDFTPWNSFVENDKVKIYDFELAHSVMPFGFDAIHFAMQQGILVDRLSWSEIKPKVEATFTELSKVSGNLNEKFEYYLISYLIINTGYHIDLYSRQEKWHEQIHWLFNTWNEALSDLLQDKTESRALMIGDLFDFLQHEDYAAVKFPNIQPKNLSELSDIDLLVDQATAKKLYRYLNQHVLVKQINKKVQSNMTSLLIILQNDQILALDLVWKLKVKAIDFMNVSKGIQNAIINDYQVKTLSLEDHQNYISCFYGLNDSNIPSKYHSEFKIEQESEPDVQALKKRVKNLPANKGISSLINKVLYISDIIRQFIFERGLIITFSGVDGAGKSTIIENTKTELEKKLRKKVVVIRHRPSLLPILSSYTHGKQQAEQIAATTLPRQGKNKSFISSLLRFSYYYTDYFFGQFYVYVKHVMRGEVILYDRYYFDFINDSVRSNIRLPKWLTKAGYKLLLKPNLNFFLYADAETILKRKKELDEKAITTLTQDYFNLFTELDKKSKDKYFLIENIHLQETMSFISSKTKTKIL